MRRLWLIIALAALGGCATVYEDRYGYYSDPGYGGDYYYDQEPASRVSFGVGYGYGFSAYDSVFWGLHHSYLDPFWYPGFYYGVTYFPSYYGWSSWYAGDYWRWRNFHPYSPYYGSYWDHYYDWTPRHGYRHGGYRGNNHGDPQRYGSARNAAERMSRTGRSDSRLSPRRAWAENGASARRSDGYVRGDLGRSRSGMPQRGVTSREGRAWQDGALRSRGYVPDSRRSPGLIGSRGDGAAFPRQRAVRGTGDGFSGGGSGGGRFSDPGAAYERRQPAIRSDYPATGSRYGASGSRAAPPVEPRMRMSAPREFRQRAPARTIDAQPSMRGGSDRPHMRSSGGASRSSAGGREGSRGRARR